RWYSSSTGAPLGANSMCFGLGACILSIYSSGNATLAGTLTQSSDVRLKRNISSIPYALDAVTKLEGVSYYWKDTNKDQSKQIGLIAQEVEKVFPELVKTNAQGFKSVAYQNLVAPIINALGEIREWMFKTDERVQSLEKDNDDLKRKNHELEQRLDKIEKALNDKK
ncbi:MAG: tail fiber domain-containing protein, partial [Bacteriovoracaceae bacterium]|nr:tail fiber domain-containing protein [Bacteriovoracaceae bacterium]